MKTPHKQHSETPLASPAKSPEQRSKAQRSTATRSTADAKSTSGKESVSVPRSPRGNAVMAESHLSAGAAKGDDDLMSQPVPDREQETRSSLRNRNPSCCTISNGQDKYKTAFD